MTQVVEQQEAHHAAGKPHGVERKGLDHQIGSEHVFDDQCPHPLEHAVAVEEAVVEDRNLRLRFRDNFSVEIDEQFFRHCEP